MSQLLSIVFFHYGLVRATFIYFLTTALNTKHWKTHEASIHRYKSICAHKRLGTYIHSYVPSSRLDKLPFLELLNDWLVSGVAIFLTATGVGFWSPFNPGAWLLFRNYLVTHQQDNIINSAAGLMCPHCHIKGSYEGSTRATTHDVCRSSADISYKSKDLRYLLSGVWCCDVIVMLYVC